MKYTIDEATDQANEFLSGIFGPEDARQPQKAGELALVLMAAYARGHEAHVPKVMPKPVAKAAASVKATAKRIILKKK